MHTDIVAPVFDQDLTTVTSKYLAWSMPSFIVCPFVIHGVSRGVDKVTSGADIAGQSSTDFVRVFSFYECFSGTV